MRDKREEFEPAFLLHRDQRFEEWRGRLGVLSSSRVLIREASATAQDGRRVRDLQIVCSPISVRSVDDNVSMIAGRVVLIAEIDEVHVGFCVLLRTQDDSAPLFVQVVGVAPEAQRRGAALALLTAATASDPLRDTALATQDSNTAARALNEKLARSINSSIERVPLGTYRDRDLGIRRGMGYRVWGIQRRQGESRTKSRTSSGAVRTAEALDSGTIGGVV